MTPRLWFGVIFVLLLCIGLFIWPFRLRRVVDEEMAPSLYPGEWILLGPGHPQFGEVVQLSDPTHPGRVVLRRVLGVAGQTIHLKPSEIKVDDYRLRRLEMGRDDQTMVLSEGNRWLIRSRLVPEKGDPQKQTIPQGELLVLADARDQATDGRWWGTVPVSLVSGKVWLRLGGRDLWRARIGWKAADGPWEVNYSPWPGSPPTTSPPTP